MNNSKSEVLPSVVMRMSGGQSTYVKHELENGLVASTYILINKQLKTKFKREFKLKARNDRV